MANHPPVSDETFLEAVREVRANLDRDIALTGELQHRMSLLVPAFRAGIEDMGPFRVGTSSHINFDFQQTLEAMVNQCARASIRLEERMPVLDSFLRRHEIPPPAKDSVARLRKAWLKAEQAGARTPPPPNA